MNSFYTSISARIPENFTKPTASFRKHVWLSVFGLLFFIVLYFTLTIWFGRLSYNLFADAINFDGHFMNYLLAIGFAFLSLFMAKSLFFLNKREENPIHRYITKKEEPLLFDYLYKLADEAGAPRPHKVFLTDRVNASVSYDISLINLIIPSKKNLEIGLGLVNVLSLGEFKAVLAHEFGHFAQRSMLLGRYVYVAQQIASRIVGKRDILDSFLAGLSSFDIRVAWIGWILSILVWAIRSLIETCFSIVVVAERALSREMEFQADLVAVSLTGSDALIMALYKLQIADQAYDNALENVNESLSDKNAVTDLYTLQSNYIAKMGKVLDNPDYGKSPVVPISAPEFYRVFTSKKYNPPKMWSTHPADIDRENNAKKIYISEPVDNKSSWDLFSNPKAYREEMTASLIKTANIETTLIADDQAIKLQDSEHFNWTFLDSKYHSNFLNRFAFKNFKSSEELFKANVSSASIGDTLNTLYPKSIGEKINLLQEVKEEIVALLVSKNEALTVEKRRVWHRGNQIKRKDIPDTLIALEEEVSVLQTELANHDKLCRTAHFKAAKALDKNWSSYIKNLTGLVHYSEHGISNINDVSNKFNNVLTIALADGNISSSELVEILKISHDYYNVLRRIYKHSETLSLDEKLLKNMKIESYQSAFEPFKLGVPSKENLNDWVNFVGGWAASALKALHKLRNESLELLLDTEEEIKDAYLHNKRLPELNSALSFPEEYDTLMPGKEREIQRKLGAWDRFAVGDGLVPSIAKFGVAASILFAAIFFGNYSQKLPFHIYNGLQTNVNVDVDGEMISLRPNSYDDIQLNYGKNYHIITTTEDHVVIEKNDFKFSDHSAFVYNVANAAIFIEHPIFYGYNYEPQGVNNMRMLGAKKMFHISSDYIFKEPPSEISMSRGSNGERKDALKAYSNMHPDGLIAAVEDESERESLIKSHSEWDDGDSKNIISWMYNLGDVNDGVEVIKRRLKRYPEEFLSMRVLQDISDSLGRKNICEKHVKLASDNPNNANYFYLATRCIEDEKRKDQKFIEGHLKWKDHDWLAYASAFVYTSRKDYKRSYEAYKVAAKQNPALAELISDSAERIKRIINYKTNENYETLVNTEDVEFYKDLEDGNVEGGKKNGDYVFYLINKGELEEAFELCQDFEDSKDYMLYLIAASDGATQKMKDAALNSDTIENGLNLNSAWSAIGLAVKENKDYTKYISALDGLDEGKNYIPELINLIKRNKKTEIEAHLEPLQLRWKAQAYNMANIILNGNISSDWKRIIQAGLFANEKPFIK